MLIYYILIFLLPKEKANFPVFIKYPKTDVFITFDLHFPRICHINLPNRN